ncbi:hypothetical protein ACFY0P_20405 [Streptomyces sp. NPDC001714]|uniref:hypothetical protein n=1 Tax=Streptomyces sp. NPDC001714 TaxID=3364603 RepID=UPI0036889655
MVSQDSPRHQLLVCRTVNVVHSGEADATSLGSGGAALPDGSVVFLASAPSPAEGLDDGAADGARESDGATTAGARRGEGVVDVVEAVKALIDGMGMSLPSVYSFAWVLSGTHDRANPDPGIPATGKKLECPGATIGVRTDGLFTENRDYRNFADFLRQNGPASCRHRPERPGPPGC